MKYSHRVKLIHFSIFTVNAMTVLELHYIFIDLLKGCIYRKCYYVNKKGGVEDVVKLDETSDRTAETNYEG